MGNKQKISGKDICEMIEKEPELEAAIKDWAIERGYEKLNQTFHQYDVIKSLEETYHKNGYMRGIPRGIFEVKCELARKMLDEENDSTIALYTEPELPIEAIEHLRATGRIENVTE